MTTQTRLDKHLASVGKSADLGILFMYKGGTKKATKITQKKGGIIYATYHELGQDIKVCISLEAITLDVSTDDTWQVSKQKPMLKKNDCIRIETSGRKQTAPYLTDGMRNHNSRICKVVSIDSRGFYKLQMLEQLEHGIPHDFQSHKWSDKWVKKLSKKECEQELVIKPFENLIKHFIANDDKNINKLSDQVREQGMRFGVVSRNLQLALQKKNMSSEDIAKEKKAEFKESLKKLERDSRIDSVDVTINGVVIKTNPLTYRCSNLPLLKEFSAQPAYEIRLNLQHQTASTVIHNHKNNPKEADYTYISSGSIHPHISSSGNPCLGNMASPFQIALAKFDVSTSAMIMIELLESYNSGSPYKRISEYYKKAPKCRVCSSKVVLGECEGCGHKEKITKSKYIMPFGN